MYDGVEGSTYVVGAQTAMASRTLSLDFEKTWRIIDFQTGGPTVSPLLLIYMCWKSNRIPMGEPVLSGWQSIPNLSPPWLVHL